MSDIAYILSADSIDAGLTVANKKGLFQQLATAAAKRTGLAAKDIVAALNEREKLGSTGFGAGVAIPHGKLPGLRRGAAAIFPLPYGSAGGAQRAPKSVLHE